MIYFRFLSVLLTGSAIYLLVFLLDYPAGIGLFILYDYLLIVPILAVIYFLGTRFRNDYQDVFYFFVVVILFALPLRGIWASGASDWNTLAGIIPIADGKDYYLDSLRLLQGIDYSTNATRRPLFSGFFSIFLFITHNNLTISLALTVLFVSLSIFLAIREFQQTHGPIAAFLLLLLLFFFYRGYVGTILTEHLGLGLGALAFTALWRGCYRQDPQFCILGLALLSFSLNARAGAFFVLPLLIIWGSIFFRKTNYFSFSFFIKASLVVAFAFLVNFLMAKYLGSPKGIAFSNFPQYLYGLLTGGNAWSVITDYPELSGSSEYEFASNVMALCIQILQDDPSRLFWGSLRAWREAILGIEGPIFSFIWIRSPEFTQILDSITVNGGLPSGIISGIKVSPYHALNLATVFLYFVLLTTLAGFNLFSICRTRRNSFHSLVIATSLGIIFSIPFAPPWDSQTMRVYASTIPFIAILPLLNLPCKINKKDNNSLSSILTTSQPFKHFCVALIILVSITPFVLRVISNTNSEQAFFNDNESAEYWINLQGLGKVSIVDTPPETDLFHNFHTITYSDFINGLKIFEMEHPRDTDLFRNTPPPFTLAETIDIENGNDIRVLTKSITNIKGFAKVSVEKDPSRMFTKAEIIMITPTPLD